MVRYYNKNKEACLSLSVKCILILHYACYLKCMLYLFRCLVPLSESELVLSSSICRLLFLFLLLCFLLFFCFFFKLQLCNVSSLSLLDASSAPVNSLAGPEPSVALKEKKDRNTVSQYISG